MSDDKMWTPVTPGDVAEDSPAMIAGQLRALQRDVRAGFESIAETLKTFKRIDEKLDVIIDRQNETDKAVAELARRVTALETKRTRKKR